MDIELQELEAQTSFVFEVAKTQPATHPVAETQELATDIEIELQESQAQNVATPPSSSKVVEKPAAKTQEPTADTEIDIQDLEVESAATLLFLHQEAETQAATTIPAAPSQQLEATMESVLQENEFLKSELEAYK